MKIHAYSRNGHEKYVLTALGILFHVPREMPSVFLMPLGIYIPAMDLVMVRYRYSQSRTAGGGERYIRRRRAGGAHNGVRRDDVVEVRKPRMSEQ